MMAELIKSFRTSDGDTQADYESLANLPTINGQKLVGDVTITASVTDKDKAAIVDSVLASFTNASEVAM